MTYTPYSKKNGDFSNLAHLAAREVVYPQMFQRPRDTLDFEDTLLELNERGAALDGEMATDRIVKVTAKPRDKMQPFKQPIIFTVQERFRRPKYARYRDLTITEWNNQSNLPSELYKLAANYFVYGYFDRVQNLFIDVIAVNVPAVLLKLCNGEMPYRYGINPRSNQSFITLTFANLEKTGCMVYRQAKPDQLSF